MTNEPGSAGDVGDGDLPLNEYVVKAAHDLRTPLTAIRGFADVLLKRGDALSADEREVFLSRIHDNAVVLDELIAALSRAARAAVQE